MNKIGIISAMQEEVQALLELLENTTTVTKGMRTYYQGNLYNNDVVIVFSRWGKVAAAATTTQLINDFELSEILFTGVAGGIQPELNIGDVVIGNELVQHDIDARPFYKQFEIPILKQRFLKTNNASKLEKAANAFFKDYNLFIAQKDAITFNITKPRCIQGAIASGDQFISSEQKIDWLKKNLPSVSCVEMEGAAVAQVCYEYEVPFSIIRIISDKANDNANIDFPLFANSIASNYAAGILKYYLS